MSSWLYKCAAYLLEHYEGWREKEVSVFNFLDYPCPLCHQPPGQPCRTLTSGRSTDVHQARVQRYGGTLFVYCTQHLAPHRVESDGSCWCGCIEDWPEPGPYGVPLEADSYDTAVEECRRKNLRLFEEKR